MTKPPRVGPKPRRMTDEQVREARAYRRQGALLKHLATIYSCSISTVHKAVNGLPPYNRIRKEPHGIAETIQIPPS